MGTTAEKRFKYSNSVSDLKQFFYTKRRQLENDIINRTISDKQIEVARKYIGIIDSVLDSEYLQSGNYALKVHELMRLLKKDFIELNKQIEIFKDQLRRMQYYLNASNEELMAFKEFGIPDEFELHRESVISMKRELFQKVETVENALKNCRNRRSVCNNLEGMICKPNGFYNAVYKQEE